MIYPIVAYGDPVLKKKAIEIDLEKESIDVLIKDMFETMYQAGGIGLAAPQIGKSIRLFIVDGTPLDELKESGFVQAFINPIILEEKGDAWGFEEGCLSIPGFRETVYRKPVLTLQYQDTSGNMKVESFDGMKARIIQHEYDHLEGVLFTDYLSALRKQLIKGKLTNISKGKVDCDYRMKFPLKK